MPDASAPTPKKRASISALRCLNSECGALLAYEVDADNTLYVDLSWTARDDGSVKYFPCPACGGKNVVEPARSDMGDAVQRVTRFQR